MKQRLLVLFALAVAAIVCVSRARAVAQEKPKRYNVLFIVADDLNCDLGCYGHQQVKTPHIDSLARSGVLFRHAYCQFPLCSPSRTSFLTGRRPNETRVLTNSGRDRKTGKYREHPHFRDYIPNTVTLPQLFRKHGYFVARVGKLYHYGVPGQIGTSGLDDRPSWSYVVNPAGRDKAEEHRIFTVIPGNYGSALSWMAMEGTDYEQTDGLVATAAISLMEANKDRPFFLAVGFYRPHTPYVAPKNYFELYPPEQVPLPQLSEDDKRRVPRAAYRSAKRAEDRVDDLTRRRAIAAYHASISFMDAQVGRVLEALERLGLADRTIVVMTSDHGYHMYQHGLWHKMSLFENSAHVPLIIRAPGAPGNGKQTQALAELVDLYPTLADLCGLPAPDYLDGVSLRPVLEDPSKHVKQAAFTQVFRRRRGGMYHGYSVRTLRWRYTLWDKGREGEQLYDMQNDPGETRNLAADPKYRDVVQRLRKLVLEYGKNTPKL